jgi:hypothetical protein
VQVTYPYDPAVHRIEEVEVTRYLRREIGREELVTWHFTDIEEPEPGKPKEKEVWVVSLFDGERLLDIGHLGDGDGTGPGCTRENAQAIIDRMKNLITRAEAKKRLKEWKRGQDRALDEMAQRHLEGRKRMYFGIKQHFGEHAAEKYALRDAPELIDGGPWSFRKAV